MVDQASKRDVQVIKPLCMYVASHWSITGRLNVCTPTCSWTLCCAGKVGSVLVNCPQSLQPLEQIIRIPAAIASAQNCMYVKQKNCLFFLVQAQLWILFHHQNTSFVRFVCVCFVTYVTVVNCLEDCTSHIGLTTWAFSFIFNLASTNCSACHLSNLVAHE